MTLHHKAVEFSIRRPRTVMLAVLVLAVALGSQIPRIAIDTDPENMLPADQSARVFHATFDGDKRYFITGLPVAEDTFGVEMFKQMGIAAPFAGLIVFLLMWFFFVEESTGEVA